MKFKIGSHEYEVKDEAVRGICDLCGLPVLKGIDSGLELGDLEFDLSLDVLERGKIRHEMCVVFGPGFFKKEYGSIKIPSQTSA